MPDDQRAPLVDALEILALLLVPALLGAAGVALLAGPDPAPWGAVAGGAVGLGLAKARRELYAVWTPDGLERRVRPATGSEEDRGAVSIRRLVAAVLFLGGGVALLSIPFVARDGTDVFVLVMGGLLALTVAVVLRGPGN